jgi:hypothetical protein
MDLNLDLNSVERQWLTHIPLDGFKPHHKLITTKRKRPGFGENSMNGCVQAAGESVQVLETRNDHACQIRQVLFDAGD